MDYWTRNPPIPRSGYLMEDSLFWISLVPIQKNAELAFQSACHTAKQHPKVAVDEILHLSSAMQFCGFRSVIGTMWQLLDRVGPFLTLAIYTYLMPEHGEGEVRLKKAAAAVREAALRLKECGDEGLDGHRMEMKAERWVNLVHIGA